MIEPPIVILIRFFVVALYNLYQLRNYKIRERAVIFFGQESKLLFHILGDVNAE